MERIVLMWRGGCRYSFAVLRSRERFPFRPKFSLSFFRLFYFIFMHVLMILGNHKAKTSVSFLTFLPLFLTGEFSFKLNGIFIYGKQSHLNCNMSIIMIYRLTVKHM